MTGKQVRVTLCGGTGSFSLELSEVKARLGNPGAIRLARRWCRQTGRDLAILTYATDEGETTVMGFMGFINGEQALLDGWVVVQERPGVAGAKAAPTPAGHAAPFLLAGGDVRPEAARDTQRAGSGPRGAGGGQMMLGDW